MKVCTSILISVITAMLVSCGSATNLSASSIPTPDIGIEVQTEKYLKIIAPDGWNSFKTNEAVTLEIRNISKNQITSGLDFGARIFVRTDQGWIEVKNKEGYEEQLLTLDPSGNDPLKTAATSVLPDLPDYSVPTYIRIYVFGNLMENGKESKKVASYVDLILNP